MSSRLVQRSEIGAGREESGKLWSRLDHVLQVVEQEEHLPLGDVLGEPVLGAERLGDLLGHEGWIAKGGEPDPEDAGLV
jgi:hypothetical protein